MITLTIKVWQAIMGTAIASTVITSLILRNMYLKHLRALREENKKLRQKEVNKFNEIKLKRVI